MESLLTPLQYIGVPTITVNQFGRIVSCNRHAATFLQLDEESTVGREWHTVVRSERTTMCCALCETRQMLRRGEEPGSVTARVRVGGGTQLIVIVPIPSSKDVSADIGFLILDPMSHGLGASSQATVPPVVARIRHLDDDRFIDDLTARERDILRCVVEGMDARSIGLQLGISHATARNYVQRILTKLGVRSKAEAVTVALTHNLLAS